MTEYWKSQARKYCEFCKCWFADNKVSISFHENGKRHKENVEKHISQLSKRSAKEFKKQEKFDDDIKKMEAAAMAAYLKDVQNNADLTSKNINEMLGQSSSTELVSTITTAKPDIKTAPMWHEVKSDDGGSYFWNTITNETTWDTPDEYLSVADQEKEKIKGLKADKIKEKQQYVSVVKFLHLSYGEYRKEKRKEVTKEVNAHLAREKMKELAVKKDPPTSPAASPPINFGPTPRAQNPYGSWTTVVYEPVEKVDLQLPKVKELPPPPVIMEPEGPVQFREKRVDSLGDGPVEFKRRKFNNARKNVRQKLEDE